jgi:hypothetical protein
MERSGSEPAVDRDELRATIEARREMGAELEPQLIDSFVERIERKLEGRRAQRPAAQRRESNGTGLALAIISLFAGIPITAIAATHGGIAALIVVWAGIVLVNFAYARSR